MADDGGHLIASRFGGPGEAINLVPMSSTVNRTGAWAKMEKEWDIILAQPGGTIKDLNIEIVYNGTRPNEFKVNAMVNGVYKEWAIDNF